MKRLAWASWYTVGSVALLTLAVLFIWTCISNVMNGTLWGTPLPWHHHYAVPSDNWRSVLVAMTALVIVTKGPQRFWREASDG